MVKSFLGHLGSGVSFYSTQCTKILKLKMTKAYITSTRFKS